MYSTNNQYHKLSTALLVTVKIIELKRNRKKDIVSDTKHTPATKIRACTCVSTDKYVTSTDTFTTFLLSAPLRDQKVFL